VPLPTLHRAAFLLLATVLAAGPGSRSDASPPDDGLGYLGAYFDAHPELKTTPSSGWKPYNRWKWLLETRHVPAGQSAFRLRLDAMEAGRARARLARGSEPGWFAIGPTQFSGRCIAVDFDPTDASVVYVGSAGGGLWKSTDGGDSWTSLTDDLPTLGAGAVCVLASDPDVVLLGTGEGSGAAGVNLALGPFGAGIFRSTDAGATWQPTSLSYEAASAHGFSVIEDQPATGVVLAGANDGLYRSTDAGDTWTQVLANGNYFDVKWKPGDPDRVYVAKGRDPFTNFQVGNGVRVSTDGGLTFAPAGTGQPGGSTIGKTRIAVTPDEPSWIYAHYTSATTFMTTGIYRSTDDGATWSLRAGSPNMTGQQGWYNLVLAADPDDADRIVTGGTPLYTSDDGGVTYTLETGAPFGGDDVPHVDFHGAAYEPGSTSALWVVTDGGPWRSTDDGSTWQARRDGLVTYQFYDICVAQSDPVFAMGGTQDNGIPGRTAFDSWFHSTFVADGMVCNIHPANANVFAEWQNGNHIRSTDGGITWSSIMGGITGAGSWVTPVDQDQNLGKHLYTSTSAGIFRTTAGGVPWTNVAPHLARWISISPVDGNVVWTVSNASSVWHTTDDGGTWTQSVAFPFTGSETKIHADPATAAGAFVTFGYYATGQPRIVRTTDFGATWTDVSGDFPDVPATTMVVDPDRPGDWYVGADVGVWRSTDAGAAWLPYGTGLANVLVTDLEIQRAARKLVAGTFGRGAWEIDLPSATVDAPVAPRRGPDLMLDPPFPNPVRDYAEFRFAARGEGDVALELFDVGGRRVATIAREARGDAVIRTATWDARSVPAGVYFVRLVMGTQELRHKVVVAR
jgi:photosystem II stability/assembly factor-like uncharacterized protein